MQLGEMHRQDTPDAAMRPDLVVVLPPDGDSRSGPVQRLKPVVVQAFVPEVAVEAFDVAVLHESAGLDQDVPDALALRPCHEGPARELRPVVSSYRQQVATKDCSAVQQPGHVVPRDAVVGRDVHTLMAEWSTSTILTGVLPHEGMLLGVWLSFFFFFFSFSGVKKQ